jgi:DUF2905 family protein
VSRILADGVVMVMIEGGKAYSVPDKKMDNGKMMSENVSKRSKLRLGRLPGDLIFERGGVRFYVPVMTCLAISIVLSLLLWLLNR